LCGVYRHAIVTAPARGEGGGDRRATTCTREITSAQRSQKRQAQCLSMATWQGLHGSAPMLCVLRCRPALASRRPSAARQRQPPYTPQAARPEQRRYRFSGLRLPFRLCIARRRRERGRAQRARTCHARASRRCYLGSVRGGPRGELPRAMVRRCSFYYWIDVVQ
jgi:hypothetical protein